MEEYFENTDIKTVKTKDEEEKLLYARFLNEVSEQTKSEFIDGEIVLHSPARKEHIDTSLALAGILKTYVDKHKLGFLGQEKALTRMDDSSNSFEPDICFFKTPKANELKKSTVLFPPPDLAIEILSESSIHRDRKIKYKEYANNSIEEYWIVDCDIQTIEQYYLEKKGKYILANTYTIDDTIACITIRNLEFPVEAIFYYDARYKYLYGEFEDKIRELSNELTEKKNLLIEKESLIIQKDNELNIHKQQINLQANKIIEKDKLIEELKKELEKLKKN